MMTSSPSSDDEIHPHRRDGTLQFDFVGDKRMKKMQQAAWRAGWAYRRTKSGMLWLSPDGKHHVTLHGTDSDHRAIKNAASLFKRAGLDL